MKKITFNEDMKKDLANKINQGLKLNRKGNVAFGRVELGGTECKLFFDIDKRQMRIYS